MKEGKESRLPAFDEFRMYSRYPRSPNFGGDKFWLCSAGERVEGTCAELGDRTVARCDLLFGGESVGLRKLSDSCGSDLEYECSRFCERSEAVECAGFGAKGDLGEFDGVL